ncbi:hypothetical protein U9M48_035693 [Paspalum notatum var. saurae]|uniref:Uncharacterized protein n=1 Tax=Paspalum notatum var. saurae TaxID=547442 RepID=A0AAQ3UFX9_PASNO
MSQPIPGPAPASLTGRGGRGRRTAAVMNWDKRYDSFKTWSGKLERQITHLAGGPEGCGDDGEGVDDNAIGGSHRTCATSVPDVERFYARAGPTQGQ